MIVSEVVLFQLKAKLVQDLAQHIAPRQALRPGDALGRVINPVAFDVHPLRSVEGGHRRIILLNRGRHLLRLVHFAMQDGSLRQAGA